jgi:acetyl esterase/lipase
MLRQLLEVGPKRWNIDIGSITTSGFSAGGNLALGLSLHHDFSRKIKACVTFYAPVDKRTPRSQKPKPRIMPNDPLTWVTPLFDTYDPSAGKSEVLADDRLAPGEVADITRLPARMMMVIPTIDILYAEEMKLAERLDERVEASEYKD